MKMGAPVIGLNDSGGARIQEGVNALAGYGRNLPTLISWLPGLFSDFRYLRSMCRRCGLLSCPDRLQYHDPRNKLHVPDWSESCKNSYRRRRYTGTIRWRKRTYDQSGVAHFAVDTEEDGLQLIRKLISFLPQNNLEETPLIECKTRSTVWMTT